METKHAQLAGFSLVFRLHLREALFALKVTAFTGLLLACVCLWNDLPQWFAFEFSYGAAVVIAMGFVAYRMYAEPSHEWRVSSSCPGEEYWLAGEASPVVSGLAVVALLFLVPMFAGSKVGGERAVVAYRQPVARFEMSSADVRDDGPPAFMERVAPNRPTKLDDVAAPAKR